VSTPHQPTHSPPHCTIRLYQPTFHLPAGLGKGGQQIQGCRKAYLSAIQLLVQLANLQTAFMTLDVALKVTNRRVNALENVVKPKIENTIAYIKVGVRAWQQ
jgi:H(+)-transporting ATP synthase subunit D